MARSDTCPKRPDLTVILPCAGEGSRLGLSYPKALYDLFPGLKLIDLSLMHLRLAIQAGFSLQVAVVVRTATMAVFEYVQKALPDITVHACPYNPAYPEWPGSVYSARAWFSPYNLVLLPDSVTALGSTSQVFDERGRCLVETVLQGLERYPVHFLYIRASGEKLRSMGAVHQKKGCLTRLADKPDADLSAYNAYWATYAFRADYGELLYRYLTAAVSHQAEPFPLSRLGPPGADPAFQYQDLGTWEALDRFRRENGDAENFWTKIATQAGMDLRPLMVR